MPKVLSPLPMLPEDGKVPSTPGEDIKGASSYTRPFFTDLHGEQSSEPVLCITLISTLSIYPMSFKQ
jgi:hypothetical protein